MSTIKTRKAIAIFAILLFLAVGYVIIFGRYHGIKPGYIKDAFGEMKDIDSAIVIKYARQLKGVLYDFSMGGMKNQLSEFGFIVCADLKVCVAKNRNLLIFMRHKSSQNASFVAILESAALRVMLS